MFRVGLWIHPVHRKIITSKIFNENFMDHTNNQESLKGGKELGYNRGI